MKSNVIDFNNPKEVAQKMVAETETLLVEQKASIEDLVNQLSTLSPETGGFEEMAALIALPDKEFNILAPIFLDELEKGLNSVNDKMVLVQAMNVAGFRAEDAKREYELICQQLDEQLKDNIGSNKVAFVKAMMGIVYNAVSDAEGISKRMINIPIELCDERAKMPTYAHESDAGMDVYALEDITLRPGETKIVPLGFKVAIPYGYEIQVRPRSGTSAKTKLRVSNAPGTIDSGYRGEVGVIIENIEPPIKDISYAVGADGTITIGSIAHGSDMHIAAGERFAQLVLSEVPKAVFYKVEDVSVIGEDRKGGFGSTGTV